MAVFPSCCEGKRLQSLDCPATLQAGCNKYRGDRSKCTGDNNLEGHGGLLGVSMGMKGCESGDVVKKWRCQVEKSRSRGKFEEGDV